MSTPRPSISVVVPVYNSEESLAELLSELEPVLTRVASVFEVILINDGSRDRSWSVVQSLAAERPWVRGMDLMRNYGQHNALLAGIRCARHDIIVTMDDDLQHPPEEIAKLLEKLTEGHDVVYGVPEQEQHGFLRDLASQATKLVLQSAMGAATARKISAFRVIRREVTAAFADYRGSFVSIDVLLTWGTTRFSSVVVRHDQRRRGISNYTVRKLIVHAVNLVTGFSTLPLQLASLIGFVFALLGLGVLAYVLLSALLFGRVVPGFIFLASIISVFSGATLFALGIIGEYLARAHFRLMDKPAYAVRTDTGREAVATPKDVRTEARVR